MTTITQESNIWSGLQPLALAMLLALTTTIVSAQSGVGVSPPRAELTMPAGSQLTSTVRVDNPSSRLTLDVEAYLADLIIAPDGGNLFLDGGSHPRSLAPWTAVNSLNFTVQPATVDTVTYTITAPEDAAPGTYWGVLFFESRTPAPEGQGGMGVSTLVRVGHIIYVTIGQATLEGRIVGLGYDARSGPGAVRLTFQNSGNGLMRMDGRVEVRSMTGELVATQTLQGVASLPGLTHDLVVPLADPLPTGEYVILAVLDYGAATVIAGEGQVQVP